MPIIPSELVSFSEVPSALDLKAKLLANQTLLAES